MIFLLLITFLSAYLFHELYWKRKDYPPGPTPLPFIGNLLSIKMSSPGYEAYNRWTKQYGEIYTFWLGSCPYIMINTFEKAKELFIKDGDTYVGKKELPFTQAFRGGIYGVIETNGETWRDHRRFALTNLRDFGLGKDLMQQKILIEVQDLFNTFDKAAGSEVKILKHIDHAVGNVINQVTFGFRYDGEREKEFHRLKKLVDIQDGEFGKFTVFLKMFAPSLKYVLPGPSIEKMFEKFRTDFYGFFDVLIEEHRRNIDYTAEENSDYVEAYLKEQKKREEDGDYESFSNRQLSNMCLDLWFAGLTTTTTTLSWAFAYILNNPKVQEKLHEELDRVIGSDRIITTADKNDLPYTNACMNEIQRSANIVALNLFHMTTKDTVINGWPVKKGTGVIAQISTIMTNEKVFPDPFTFNPERFIENGKLRKIDDLVPFSLGKRQCLGEGLARMELFLFFANVMNRYKIKPSSDGLPSLDKSKHSMVQELDYNSILEIRVQ